MYAELNLAPGDTKTAADQPKKQEEGTEYAEIVGVLNNQDQEKKE